jgi:putative ABC transport system substrate-binding protein
MRRRDFTILLGAAVAVCALGARAQSTATRRIGVLMAAPADDARLQAELAGFRDTLARLGWVEGRNLQIDYRFAGGNGDLFPTLAKELIALHPDVLFAQSTPATAALQREARAAAIVFEEVSDPIGSGFVASLARPGGNLTGILQYEPGITGKWLAMLKEIAPGLARAALLANPKGTNYPYFLRNAMEASGPLAIEIISSPVDNVTDIERSISSLAREGNGGLLVPPEGFTNAHRQLIIALAAEHRLPAVYPWRYFVTDGGLMSYGVDLTDVFQKAASYVDRILRGASPSDLPVQVPTKYETVLNLRTARALGLSVSELLLVRADEVVE